jgi:restriction endonuclease S subunit
LLETPLPVPPLNEQKRIVAKIEELLPKVNAVRERLIRVKEIMKRFRQSVLSAACSGRLTEDWRYKSQEVETGQDLIKRVLEGRMRQYEAECREAKKEGKRIPPKPNHLEYRKVKTDDLPEMPQEWDWAYLPFFGYMNRGKSRHRPRNAPHLYGGPYPFIQTGDIAQSVGKIRSHRQTYSEAGLKQSKIWPEGTVCITIAANIAHSGLLTYPACFPDSVVGVVPDGQICHGEFLEYFIRIARTGLDEYAPSTSQKNINIAILNDLAVPVPPLIEQAEIVRRVEAVFKIADTIEKRVEAELLKTEKMTQGILAKAFRGELVPTDAELLHREENIGTKSVVEQGESYKKVPVIYTIGHSVHSLEKLVGLLSKNRIEVLVDIRSEPYSRKVPQFNKDNLEKEIRKSGLKYLFLGKELGGRPPKHDFYDKNGFVLYSKIADSAEFKTGLERVLKGIEKFRVALMCSEENPSNCHRHLLVGRVLSDRKVRILHIRGDGEIQSDAEIRNSRYQAQKGQSQQSLFVSEESSEWKSTQSVLRRKAPNNSSAH